jgi:hypothetical protein
LDVSSASALWLREESKAVSPLRSATALHEWAALWTAVGSDSATPLWMFHWHPHLGRGQTISDPIFH